MAILGAIGAGVASFVIAVVTVFRIWDVFKDRWTKRRLDVISAVFCFAMIGASPYTMAAFNEFSFSLAAWIHVGVGCFFAAIVLLGVANYIEGFFVATIACILVTLLVLRSLMLAQDASTLSSLLP